MVEVVFRNMPVTTTQVSPQPAMRKHISSAVKKIGAGIVCARDVISSACPRNLGIRIDLRQQYPRPALRRQIRARRTKFENKEERVPSFLEDRRRRSTCNPDDGRRER